MAQQQQQQQPDNNNHGAQQQHNEDEVRRRVVRSDELPSTPQSSANLTAASSSSDDDDHPLTVTKEKRLHRLKRVLPQASDKLGSYMDSALCHLPERWRNWVVRGILSIVMISFFYVIVGRGVTWLMAVVFLLQLKCFSEIINIGLAVYRLFDLPWFRALSWYFLITSDYFFFGESLIDYLGLALRKDEFLRALITHHRLISFVLYCFGFIWFVLSLQKGFYLRQFSLFAWTHVTLLIIVSQSFLILQNLFQGMIWFLVPVSMIICCDIMSYMFGFFFGKTPLIKLSPKKTWEGFIGGAFSTILFGLVLSSFMVDNPKFVCPMESYYQDYLNCTIPPSFQPREFDAPRPLSLLLRVLHFDPVLRFRPFLAHSVVLALFASLIGPFGGFFASGFKRAFKIKDFGDIIPGHGGLMDRFDCQLLMGSFVNVYISSFIRSPNPNRIVQQTLWLPVEDQLAVYHALQEQLIAGGVIGG
uniref:Phosphatidate cytidylyltransferase n=1 Tax=Globodera rostochiensis TaxID=31243 RepID=A0A914IBW1_GLORO